jgi:N12 class adenine-specific DNA methylase
VELQLSLFAQIEQIEQPTPELPVLRNYSYTEEIGVGSVKEKVKRNLEAIRLLQLLEETGRHPNDEQKAVLAQYMGFGLAPELFMETPPASWQELACLLKELVSTEQWYQLRSNVTNAYYTSPDVIREVHQGLMYLGFTGGKILEPGLGSGLWIGLVPETIQHRCKWTGVEIDPISGKIAQLLYPEAEIHIRGFQEATLPYNFFDLTCGNVPFGTSAPTDPTMPRIASTLHDYFFVKAMHLARPGGLIAMLTSVGTLQSRRGRDVRQWIATVSDLVGAMRLPCTAFQKFTGTSVTTDLLIFKKREQKEVEPEWKQEWVEVCESDIVGEDGNPLMMSSYYKAHPEMMLGKPCVDKLYGPGRSRLGLADDGRDLRTAIREAFRRLPDGIYTPALSSTGSSSRRSKTMPIPPELQDRIKPYNYVWLDNKPWQVVAGRLTPCPIEGTAQTRLYWLIQLRDTVKRVFEIQVRGGGDEELAKAQKQLNISYDRFVKRYGWVHDVATRRVFADDPEYPLLLALENYDPDRPEKTTKTEIFNTRTIAEHKPKTSAGNAKEALVYSLSERGRIDLDYMAMLLSSTEASVIEELEAERLIYHDPETRTWVSADEYLSGNVRLKLSLARNAALLDSSYQANIEALLTIQPKELSPGEIYARLGTAWIPTSDIEQFIAETLNVDKRKIHVHYLQSIASWSVDVSVDVATSQNNTKVYGTSRIAAHRLIEMALNLRIPIVKDKISDEEYVVNKEETRKARTSQENLKDKFKRWLWSDLERADRLAKLYNEKYNCFALRKFNGSHLELPGMNPIWRAKLKPHQLNAIWRIICTGNALISHPVGAGKTIVMIAAAMELKRLGLCSKPCLVVKDHMVEQVASEVIQLYPKARVLIAGSAQMSKQKRQEMTARMATGDWDIVLTSHTGFSKLKLGSEIVKRVLEEECAIVEAEYKTAKLGFGDESKRAVKVLERKLDSLKQKILDTANNSTKDDTIAFELIGIDTIFYDESQDVKRKELNTKMDRVLGVPNGSSYRAEDFYQKTRYMSYVLEPGRGIVLLTATPLSNSMAEGWVNQLYLQYHTLQQLGLLSFDSWVSNYAEIKVSAEITAQLTIEVKSRLALFNNLPEWRTLFWQIADVVCEEELDIAKPTFNYETVEVPATTEQLKFFESIAKRAEAIQAGLVEPEEDNMPLITTHVRQGVIDLRLLQYSVLSKFLTPEEIEGLKDSYTKVDACIDNVYRIWKETRHTGATQLIFCDMGTPNKKNKNRFCTYDKIKFGLVAKGVPASDIAYIHDAKTDEQKDALFRSVRYGKVGIFILSTEKGGVGTNCQDNVCAQHDLDCPLRPTDHTQRRGRSVRQGNRHDHVTIYRYVTQGKPYTQADGKTVAGLSPDSYLYQMSITKATFIEQALSGRSSARSIEDCSDVILSLSEAMASATGDPRLIRKVELDNQIGKLLIEERDYINQQLNIKRELERLPGVITSLVDKQGRISRDLNRVQDTSGKKFRIFLNDGERSFEVTKRVSAGQFINQFALELEATGKCGLFEIGKFSGFDVVVERPELFIKRKGKGKDKVDCLLHLVGEERYTTNICDNALGTIKSLEYLLSDRMLVLLQQTQDAIASYQKDYDDLAPQRDKPFVKAVLLAQALTEREELERELGLGVSASDVTDIIAS